ncbi:helix-turn-helix transcriptional regulator [Streptomyces sp. NPDC097619]|uniref:helix-turn-helix transcriptional regulator n=1 Tax=Streptomyces sp. NPDC097619 TaxID=3157228 RepID=UPI00332A2565
MQRPRTAAGRASERVFTREPDEAAAWMRAAYGTSLRMGALESDRPFLYRRDAVRSVAVSLLRLPAPCRYRSEPLGTLTVTEVRAGRFARSTGKENTRAATGDVMAASQPDLPYQGHLVHAELRAVTIATPVLRQVAGLVPDDTGRAPRFRDLRPLAPRQAGTWRATVDYLTAAFLRADGSPPDLLLLDSATRLLAATALSLFVPPHDTPFVPRDGRDASPATVRRAVSYIEGAAHGPVTLADIAAAAFVTPRALQYAFRRHLDTTPLGYLRRVRLARAHAELRAAEPGGSVTVSAVAARWGFLHQGRFAAAYRLAYDRAPGRTLAEPARGPR